MRKLSKTLMFGFVLFIFLLPAIHAQTSANPPATATTTQANPAPAGQAPDDVLKKLSDLVHDGKYAEAQQLTAGLLIAYPQDQRLIKSKALLDKLSASAPPTSASPTVGVTPPQPTANITESLTGMDKVDYNTLIELARQAQQNKDLELQKTLLKRFMDQSTLFLQKHPGQTLVWQLRAASALSLDDSDAGYEAGQKLLAAGAANSDDPNLQRLIAQLNAKGWLDKQKVEAYKKYGWILGTWSVSWHWGTDKNSDDEDKQVFVKSKTGDVEGYYLPSNGRMNSRPDYRGAILDSGQISWQQYMPVSDNDPETAGGHTFRYNRAPGKQEYPSGWQSPISYVLSDDKKTITMTFPPQSPNPKRDSQFISQNPVILTFVKISDSQGQ